MKGIFAASLLAALLLPLLAPAQVGVGGNYDIDYLTPKKYEIGGIEFENAENFDTRMILLVAGLQVGDNISVPGDRISTAVDNLWKQGMFEDVKITVTRIQGSLIFLKIILTERPKMSKFRFTGVGKSDSEKLRNTLKISAGDVVTENMLQTSVNKIRSHYIEKGFSNVKVTPGTEPDTANGKDRVIVVFNVERGKRVKIDSLILTGNENVSINKLQRKNKIKNTHDIHYGKKMYVWTKGFWTRSKYREADFEQDLDAIITYYNELGYRDARILSDTAYLVPNEKQAVSNKKKAQQDRLIVKAHIFEGKKYYFRNITFSGNTLYPNELLSKNLRIEKGMPYNRTQLETNLNYNPSGTDITSMYMDNGYLFFRCDPVETAVVNDSIDIEIRISEGKQARIKKVSVEGNTITNDKAIYRELRTRPGNLFSREDLLRSRRELIALSYFKEETLMPEPKPNQADGTVDIVYKVDEKQSSTMSLSGGYGGNMFVIQAGIQLNNFSARNIFRKDAWKPLPAGDGQKLGINISTNLKYFGSVGLSFTEPWLGGKRPQSFTIAVYHNFNSNGYFYQQNNSKYSSLRLTGASTSLTRRLKWPDDYFILSVGIGYKHYNVQDSMAIMGLAFTKGQANDLSANITLQRNSYDSPIYTRSGSEISLSLSATPPYSLLSGKDFSASGITESERYKWLEYFNVNLRGSWMYNLVGDLVLNTKFRMGFMGYYNKDIGLSPFGRYYLGGNGLQSYTYDGREVVPLRGYDEVSLNPKTGASIFNRFTLELHHPIVESAASTIWVIGFLDGGNSWERIKDYQPFNMYNSAGLGVRLVLPAMGMFGIDWGYGFDNMTGKGGSHVHFSIGSSID
ncbi:MAG: outer membrane protein assembly factor BamA [Bacteroidales bacterium]|nr:outer membrane protein assembly factor BamA [Bacteroidales bacterium]